MEICQVICDFGLLNSLKIIDRFKDGFPIEITTITLAKTKSSITCTENFISFVLF